MSLGVKYLIAKCRIVQAVEKCSLWFICKQPAGRRRRFHRTSNLRSWQMAWPDNYQKSASVLNNLSKFIILLMYYFGSR